MSKAAPIRKVEEKMHDNDTAIRSSYEMFLGGQWLPSETGDRIEVVNPADGAVLSSIPSGAAADVDRAVAAARAAFTGPYAAMTWADRQRLLLRIHDVIAEHFDELAQIETLDMGAPLARSKSFRSFVLDTILYYAAHTDFAILPGDRSSPRANGLSTTLQKSPVGVVGGIVPWNAPLLSQWWIVGPAIATGCTVVLKPAEEASLTILRTAELLQQAGLPDGVVNVVTGGGRTAGAALAEHRDVDLIAFTGSTATGSEVTRASASNLKRTQLELGGKSANIVFDDVDLDAVLPQIAMASYKNSGQICTSASRILVHKSRRAELIEKLTRFATGLKVGPGIEADTDIGPLISPRHMARVRSYLETGLREGARLVYGGPVDPDDPQNCLFRPTLFDQVTPHMTLWREEIFGPIAVLVEFDSDEEAIALANDSAYGLSAGVWSRDLSRAHRTADRLDVGTVWVNCYGDMIPSVGFGGRKLSGDGWKGGEEHLDRFLTKKAIYLKY